MSSPFQRFSAPQSSSSSTSIKSSGASTDGRFSRITFQETLRHRSTVVRRPTATWDYLLLHVEISVSNMIRLLQTVGFHPPRPFRAVSDNEGRSIVNSMILPITDFNRIHQVIHGTLSEEGNPAKSCTLFACIGAMILNKHYKIPARVVAGGFAMCIEPENIMFFGRKSDDRVTFDEDGFHMWVQTKTHIIDFMSPLFNEAIADTGRSYVVPRKMFQKRMSSEAKSLDDLNAPGDFYAMADPELSERLLDHIMDRPINRDFINFADQWFGKRRGKQRSSAMMGGNDGSMRELHLATTIVRSAW